MSGSAPEKPEGPGKRDEAEWFAQPVRTIVRPWREQLARRLAAVEALGREEREAVLEAGHTALLKSLHAKLSRLFLIELHALRIAAGGARNAEGAAAGSDTQTWTAFLERAAQEGYLDRLAGRYPNVGPRIASVARLSVAATAGFAERLAADRELLRPLLGAPRGRCGPSRSGRATPTGAA